jgi:hypothetical protein
MTGFATRNNPNTSAAKRYNECECDTRRSIVKTDRREKGRGG